MPGILCEHCTGHCCRYIALPIDEPEDKKDLDDIRWYLLHENISVFVEDGEWFINVATPCRHLQADFRCGIYETRPRICRDYSTENCDYHSGDYEWSHHFTCPDHLDEFAKEFLASKKKRGSGKSRNSKAKQGSNGRSSSKTGPRRSGLRAKLAPMRKRKPAGFEYAAATTDIRGTPLPVLRIQP